MAPTPYGLMQKLSDPSERNFKMNFSMNPRAALTVALLLPLAACAGSEGETAWTGTVVDSAGISIVRSTGDGIWGGSPAWTLEEIFRVGGMEGGPDAEFGLVAAVDADAEGNVYILDQQAREIRVYNPDGSLRSVIGGPGGGPGEFGPGLVGMFEHRDTVWGIDVAGQGLQGFNREGERIAQAPMDLTGGVPLRLDETAQGLLAQRRGLLPGTMVEGVGDPITVIRGEIDTLMTLPPGESFSMQGGVPQLSFFQPEPLWDAADDGGIAWGTNKVYRVHITDLNGTTVRIVERELAAQPVTESIERGLRSAVLRQMSQASGAPEEMLAPVLAQATFAETLPLLAQIILGEDGYLWVQQVGQVTEQMDSDDFDIQDLGSPIWDIFDAEGRYLGDLRVPDRFQPVRLIDNVLWGIQLDEFDVPSVVGMRVVRATDD